MFGRALSFYVPYNDSTNASHSFFFISCHQERGGTGTSYQMEHMSSPLVFSGVRVSLSYVFYIMLCRSLFVLLSFFLRPLCCLSFDLWLLNTPLVSLNFSIFVPHTQRTPLLERLYSPQRRKLSHISYLPVVNLGFINLIKP